MLDPEACAIADSKLECRSWRSSIIFATAYVVQGLDNVPLDLTWEFRESMVRNRELDFSLALRW
jgi:hypothetical protein